VEEQFALDTHRIIARWFIFVWDAGLVLVAGVGTVGLAIEGNPFSALFLALCAAMAGFMHWMAWGFGRSDKNYVLLKPDGFEVRVFVPFRSRRKALPYSWVRDIVIERNHSGRWLFGYWPYTPMQPFDEHVDVLLDKARWLSGGWGRPSPWARVIHLDVAEPDALAQSLRDRVSALPRAPSSP
jgi:hypothetical protein